MNLFYKLLYACGGVPAKQYYDLRENYINTAALYEELNEEYNARIKGLEKDRIAALEVIDEKNKEIEVLKIKLQDSEDALQASIRGNDILTAKLREQRKVINERIP